MAASSSLALSASSAFGGDGVACKYTTSRVIETTQSPIAQCVCLVNVHLVTEHAHFGLDRVISGVMNGEDSMDTSGRTAWHIVSDLFGGDLLVYAGK